jgi:hypothetical protein
VVGLGASNFKAVKNAILVGEKAAKNNLTEDIKEAIAKSKVDLV